MLRQSLPTILPTTYININVTLFTEKAHFDCRLYYYPKAGHNVELHYLRTCIIRFAAGKFYDTKHNYEKSEFDTPMVYILIKGKRLYADPNKPNFESKVNNFLDGVLLKYNKHK